MNFTNTLSASEISHPPIQTDIHFEALDSLPLYGWMLPGLGTSKGNLVIIHGMKDHSLRYLDFARRLSREGYTVFGMDLRGHGRSGGENAYLESINTILDDMREGIANFRHLGAKSPWILMGHSEGGSLVTRYLLEHRGEFLGAVLSAPLLKRGEDINSFKENLLRLLDKVAPHFPVVDLKDEDFTNDFSVVQEMRTDPRIHDTKLPARTGVVLLDTIDEVNQQKSSFTTPFLILHSESDMINTIDGSKEFYADTPEMHLKEFRQYFDLAHDLLHEPEHLYVEEDILTWMNKLCARSLS